MWDVDALIPRNVNVLVVQNNRTRFTDPDLFWPHADEVFSVSSPAGRRSDWFFIRLNRTKEQL